MLEAGACRGHPQLIPVQMMNIPETQARPRELKGKKWVWVWVGRSQQHQQTSSKEQEKWGPTSHAVTRRSAIALEDHGCVVLVIVRG